MKRNRLITALLVLAVFFQLFSGICVYASENMATNSGFDKNTDGWIARYGATVTWR